MLLTNAKKSGNDCAGYRVPGPLGRAVLLLCGILMTAGIAFAISKFDTGSRGKVYAEELSSETGGQRFQAGLTGIVSGVADMERYAEAIRLADVGSTKEDTLAGAGGIDRRAIRQEQLRQGTHRAGELGYYAQQVVKEYQMPQEEYYTLLQIVEAEATGGDVMSKMMVAGVVLNRVRDPHFPDTISGVVWQEDQFQPTSDGRIYSCTITDSTVEAVDRVLQGEDYSEGALFFLARGSAELKNADWFDASLEKLFEYGGHEYYTYRDHAES